MDLRGYASEPQNETSRVYQVIEVSVRFLKICHDDIRIIDNFQIIRLQTKKKKKKKKIKKDKKITDR